MKIHPLYQHIVEKMIQLDTRDFQSMPQERLVAAMNYLHREERSAPTSRDTEIS